MVATPTTNISFQNFFSTTLSADITDTATDIFLNAVPNGSEGFLVIEPDSTTNREIIYYTSKTALKVTCPSIADGRGQDDTTAHAHVTGATVIMAPVAAFYEALLALFQTTPAGWTSIAGNISAVSYNGNRSYDLTTSSDNTAVISPGSRIRTTRTVAAPTQCTSLNGSSQYFNDTTVSGMTFTDDFTVSAWVKLSAYGTDSRIASRYNGTSGWAFGIDAAGKIALMGFNGSSSNISYVISWASIPVNKWVHVAAQLDMSSFTATTTTSYVMIDGIDVPAQVSRGGTNPTALVQAGNLEIGSWSGGAMPWPGKIAQVAIYSAKVTQANIKATISQGLSGSETSLVSAYSFNNSLNDLNASNANNLTAQGSAVATNADSPFGGQASGSISSTLDYGIVQKATASTLTVQVAEGCTIPTSGGVSSASYSTFKVPYGFPAQKSKWNIRTDIFSNQGPYSVGSGVVPTVGGWEVSLPVGAWSVSGGGTHFVSGAATIVECGMTLTLGAFSVYSGLFWGRLAAVTNWAWSKSDIHIDVSTVTKIYGSMRQLSGGARDLYLTGSEGQVFIIADNAYL